LNEHGFVSSLKHACSAQALDFYIIENSTPVSGKVHTTYLIKAKCAQAGPDTHVNQKKKKKLTESLNYTNITCPMFFTKKERPHPLLKKYIYEQA
jgi:hypothetical protein